MYPNVITYGLCRHTRTQAGDVAVLEYETGSYVDVHVGNPVVYHRVTDAVYRRLPEKGYGVAVPYEKVTSFQTGVFSSKFEKDFEHFFLYLENNTAAIATALGVEKVAITLNRVNYNEEAAHSEDFGPYKLSSHLTFAKYYWLLTEYYSLLCTELRCLPENWQPKCT